MAVLYNKKDLCNFLGISTRTGYSFLNNLQAQYPKEKCFSLYVNKQQRFTEADKERIIQLCYIIKEEKEVKTNTG